MAKIKKDIPIITNEISGGLHNTAQPVKGVKLKMVRHKLRSGEYWLGY